MKICRFDNNQIGVIRNGYIHDATAIFDRLQPTVLPTFSCDPLIANLDALREVLENLSKDSPPRPVASVSLLSPVANPSKIIGITNNYYSGAQDADHETDLPPAMRRLKEPELFIKPGCTLVGPSQGVTIRFADRPTEQEAELGVVIGRTGSDIAEADALEYVAGYAAALDMAVRGPEERSVRKSPDSYAVLGPWLVTKDEIANPENLDFELRVNSKLRQRSNTRLMRVRIARQIAWASSFFTLYPGDVLMTGTCEGAGTLIAGDTMTMMLQCIGEMTVVVRGRRAEA